jgi:hypothetical protein
MPTGRVTHVSGTLRTIDELKSQEAKLIHYADSDQSLQVISQQKSGCGRSLR